MRYSSIWFLIIGLAAVGGCSRQQTTACESDARYSTARSAPPVQIPDDLSPPNESDALRLPPDVATAQTAAGECLEAPPSFFGESRPFRRSGDDEEREPAPVEPSEPTPASGDRVIDN
jgi:hypothetical protein